MKRILFFCALFVTLINQKKNAQGCVAIKGIAGT